MKFWVAKGQPGTLGHNPKTGAYIAASDPGAVFGGLNQQSKFLTLNDDQGEIVRLNMKNARAPKLNIFSMASHRELSQEEIEARWAPIAGNPYITLPSRANSEKSNMKQDLSELNQVMAKVDDGFDVKHRANRKAPSNRLSADRFNAALIDMAHEHRAWREQKLQAWLKRGRKAKDFREERNQEADIVFIAEGPSFDVTIRKKQDLEAVMPGLHVQIVRGNEYMAKKDNYYSGNGSPFRIGPNTIIFSISQSGMTFSNVEAIRDAEIMRKNGKVRDVFIMTGEWFTILGRSLGQEYFPGSDFGGRIFSNMSGRRLSEAATMASATDFFFTKLFMDTFKVLGKEVPEGSLEYMPFNMKLTSHAIDRLEQEVSPLLKEGVSKITGTDANGKTVDSNINEALLGQGRDIANHVSEQFFSLVAVRLYTFFSVLFHLPIFQTIAFLFTFSMILMTEAESFVEALQSLPVLEIVMFFGVWFVAHVLDSIFYTFQDLFYTYWLRYVQGRAVLDRVGPRFLAIGSPHWSLLRDYFRAALLEAPAVLQLSGVDGRKVEGDFMHAFKDVPRGAIGFFQFDDSPESTTPVTLTAGAGKMSINQASGVRNWGAGPHILINTLNPAVASRYKYPPVTVSEGNEFADNDPALNNEAFRTFHSRWFNELKLLVAGQVVAAEMAEVLSKVEIPFYVRRSESWSASFLEMFANIFSRLYSRIALKAYSAMMQFWYRTPPMDRIFAPGKGQSGLTVFTTQLVAPRPNKTGEAARNIRAIAHALMREGLDESAPWIPKAGSDNEDRASVIAYVYAQLYNPRADRQPAFVNLRAPIEPSSPEMENITVPALAGSGERYPRRREFSWGGSAENNEGSARSEVRGDRSKLKLRLEQLEDRRFLANGAFEYYLPHPKAFSEFVDVDIQTQDEVFKELGGSPQAENVKVVIGEETVTVDENGPVTRIEFSYYVDEGLVRVSLDDFKYDKLGKPISFTYTESRDGKTVSRQIDGKFTEYDDKGRPVKGIAEDEKSQFKAVLRFSYPEAVKDSKVGVVQEAMITEKDGSKTIVKIDIETIKYQVDTSDEDNQAIENGTVIVSSSGGGGGSSDNSVSSNSGGNDEKKQSAFEELDLGGGSANPGMRPQDGLKLIPNFDLNPMPGAPGDYDLAEAEEEVENVATPENGADSPAAISALRAPAPSIDASNEPEVPVPGSWKSLDAIAAATLAVAAVFHVKKPSKKQTLLFWGSLGLIFAAGTVFAYFFASGLVPVIILAAVAFFYFTYHLEKQNTVRISVSRDGKTLNLFLPPSAGVQVRNRNVQLTFQRVGSEYRTSDGSLRALVNSTGREISFFHADDNQFPFISTNGEETFQRINVPVSRSVINKIQVVSSATRTQRGAAFKVSPAFLVKVLGYGLLTGLIAAFIWFGLPAIAAWSQISVPSVLLQQLLQNSSALLFWGGILAPAAGFLWMLKEPRKKSARLSWVAWTRGWIFRAMFLAGVAALGYGALFLGLAPLSFIAAGLWLFYGFIFIGYLIPNALGWFATVLSIPFRWMPRIYARSSLRQDLTAAVGIAAIVSGSYFGYRAYSVQIEDFERKIQNVTQNFSAAIWPKETFKPEKNSEDKIVPENSTAQVSLGIEEDSVLPAKFEFENIEPLLYSAGAEDITVSVISPKEGYLSLHPKSGIRTNEYQNPGKAFPLVGGEPLLHVERPVTQISAERQKVMAEYLKAVADRFQPLWERGVMSERERLFYKSAHVLTSVENYDSAQEADVYGTIRVPLATGEKGFLLPSERPLGTTNGTTNSDESLILGRVHSQHRLTMRVAVPLSVWNQYDLTKIKTTVLFGGQQREARVVHLTAEPRLDGTLILTLGLLSKEQIFGWDFANSKPVPVSLLLNLQPKEDSSLYSNHLSEYVQVSSYAQLDDRKTFPVNSTDAIGRASFNVEESSWVSPKQIVAGVGEKDRERLKALIQQSKEYSQEVKRMLEAYLRLYYKGAMNAAPPEVRKFSEDVNRLSLLPGKWNTLDYEAPQVGIIHNTFNSEGQAVLGQPVAEILTPQITIHQRIEKRIGVNIGDIVIVRRPASEEETLGIVRQVNRELTNKDRGEDQKNFQEISIELNNTPRLWFFSGEYGVQVIYVPADKNGVKSQKAQEWLRGQYANLERERARIFSSANIQSLKPLYPMQFVTPASESDRLLLIKLLEAPLTSNETGEENIAFQNLPKALANEQRGDKDPQFSNEGNLELRRILNESNGGQRREWMRLYLQNQNIPLHDLKNIILYGPTDTAQMSLDYLLRQRRIADLVMIHRDLFAKSPELDMTKLARAHIIELIETDEDPLKRLVQLEHGDLKRAAAQEFLVSLISSEDAAFDPDLAISVRKVLSSSFWRTYADKLQLARALENVSKGNPLEIRRKKAAFLIRNIVFGQIAQNVRWAHGEPQEHAKGVGAVQRFDGWVAGWFSQPGVWDRLEIIEKSRMDDLEWLEHSPWVIAYTDPRENFNGRIHQELYDKALDAYEAANADAENTAVRDITVLDFEPQTGSFHSDHVYKFLDPLTQRNDYLQTLSLHALERLLQMSERPENKNYRLRREQIVDRLVKENTPQSKLLLARTLIKTSDREILQLLFDKHVDGLLIDEMNHLNKVSETEPGLILLYQQALAKLAGLKSFSGSVDEEGRRRLAIRVLLDTLTDFELKDLSEGRHQMEALLKSEGVNEEIIRSTALEQLRRHEMLWAIPTAASWKSNVTFKSQVFVQGEAALKNLEQALGNDNLSPERVEAALAAGRRDYPDLFRRMTALTAFRDAEIQNGSKRDHVGHLQTWRLSIGLVLGVIALAAGFVGGFISMRSSRPYSLNRRRGSFFPRFSFSNLFSFRTRRSQNRESAGEFETDSIDEENNDVNGEARSEVRKAPEALLQAVESKEIFLKKIRVQQELNFSIYKKLARERGIDFSKALLNSHAVIERKFLNIGSAHQNGEVILNYEKESHTENFPQMLAKFMTLNPGVRQMNLIKGSRTSNEDWNAFKTALRTLPGFNRLRVSFGDEKGFSSLETLTIGRLKARRLPIETLIQVLEPSKVKLEERKDYETFLMGAALLGRETIIVLGGDDPMPGVRQYLTVNEILETMFQAQRRVLESA